MIRRFASARLFPQSADESKRTIQIQIFTACAGWHSGHSIKMDFRRQRQEQAIEIKAVS
jgi:hypothetical protein